MQIEDFTINKNVLMIPVYSTRSYKNGVYDLLADGNMSKYLMKIIKSRAKKIDILFPENSEHLIDVQKIVTKNVKTNVNWIPFRYGINAHETRMSGQVFYNFIINQHKQYDVIISEIDTLAEFAKASQNELCDKNNFIYWVGSWNASGTRWDDENDAHYNQDIAKEIVTACLLPGQVDFFGGESFYDKCDYEPEYFAKKVIFFPFRLSDKSYHLSDFMKAIQNIRTKGYDNFVVLYTDPNDSGLLDGEDSTLFVKAPKNKYIYLSILKGKPIIPYLDDVTKNYHSNIFEFTYYGCDVIMLKNDLFQNTTQIGTIEELTNALIKKLEG